MLLVAEASNVCCVRRRSGPRCRLEGHVAVREAWMAAAYVLRNSWSRHHGSRVQRGAECGGSLDGDANLQQHVAGAASGLSERSVGECQGCVGSSRTGWTAACGGSEVLPRCWRPRCGLFTPRQLALQHDAYATNTLNSPRVRGSETRPRLPDASTLCLDSTFALSAR